MTNPYQNQTGKCPSVVTSSNLVHMVETNRDSALLLRAGGRNMHPSPNDIQQIRDAVAVVTENFESLVQVVTDDRTVAESRRDGNGEAQGLTPADLQDIAKELSDTLTALSREVLCVDTLREIAVDLDRYLTKAWRIFEVRSEQFTPRPADHAAPAVIAGTLYAGLSDAAGAFSQLLGLLEDISVKSAEAVEVPEHFSSRQRLGAV